MTVIINKLQEKKTSFRHPEKRNRLDTELLRKPSWIRVKAPVSSEYQKTKSIVKSNELVTVCEEAGCPNIGECWQKSHASFMIMGEICTRACAFCNVKTGLPNALDSKEPEKIAEAIKKMRLKHAVITSVDRDDLTDGGAQHFYNTVKAIRRISPETTIEILTPDFFRKPDHAIKTIIDSKPDVFNHNLETVPRLYLSIRPGARYFHSLKLLSEVKRHNPRQFTKSGLMVGLGETKEEIMQVMDDMRAASIDFITIGQYLQPTRKHAEVKSYITPELFKTYEMIAKSKGFLMVSATPLTRSSYHAGDDFRKLRQARNALLSTQGK